jgi:multidrug efflux system membrane fusion protein
MNAGNSLRRFFRPFAQTADLFPNQPTPLTFRAALTSSKIRSAATRKVEADLEGATAGSTAASDDGETGIETSMPSSPFGSAAAEASRAPLKGMAAAAILVAAAFFLTGCGRGAQQQHAPPPPSVTVAAVEQKQIVEWDEFTGRTEPVEAVEVRPRVSGYIQKIKFQSGQLVKKGDVLLRIDPRWHQAEFDRRKAEFEQAKVRLENAQREADRSGKLLADKAISTEESDARQSRCQEGKAAVLAASAALDSARLDLEYTEVRSPIDGRVSRAFLTEGNYVSGIAGAATLLTTIVSVDPVYVYADVDENSLLKFNELAGAKKLETNGDGKIPVALQLADEQEFPHNGYIESFDNRLVPETGSILLRAVFPNPDGRIVPGLFARIRVPLSEKHPVLLVEERAIGTDQAQKFVLRLTSTNTVEYRPVILGPLSSGKRIVRSGLEGSEKIVVNGLARVRPGMPVAPQEAIATSPGEKANPEPKLATR